jgi:hypothetical protein
MPDAVADPAGGSGASAVDQSGATVDQPPAAAIPDGGLAQATAVTSENADPAAVTACSKFAEILDNASDGYGNYADSLDDNDPSVNDANVAGRTSLRAAGSAAMDAANTPGLSPDIADPMRAWSVGIAKLIVKMGLHMTGGTLDSTAADVNNNAEAVQRACAAAGTHA